MVRMESDFYSKVPPEPLVVVATPLCRDPSQVCREEPVMGLVYTKTALSLSLHCQLGHFTGGPPSGCNRCSPSGYHLWFTLRWRLERCSRRVQTCWCRGSFSPTRLSPAPPPVSAVCFPLHNLFANLNIFIFGNCPSKRFLVQIPTFQSPKSTNILKP
jgi:hypothetical protein